MSATGIIFDIKKYSIHDGPGTRTTQRMAKALQPAKPIGTLFADPIRASSPSRLHQKAGQTTAPDQTPDHHFMLATREPSTDAIRSLG